MSDDKNSSATMFNMDAVVSARQLSLSYAGKTVDINPEDTPFIIGREPDSTKLCVPSQFASRQHCQVIYQNRHFMLEDTSTNGTHIRIGVNPPLKLEKSSTTLTGTGSIKLGEAIKVGDKDVISYKVVY